MSKNRIIGTGFTAPLHSWDIFSMYLNASAEEDKRQAELAFLIAYQKRHGWDINLERVLDRHYEALVLTDARVRIEWVSDGFTRMTGYPRKEAIGQSPRMLQGMNTTQSSRERVRLKLYGQHAFTEDIVNYRKSGEEYICRVEIHPIFGSSNHLCHFLALEEEVK